MNRFMEELTKHQEGETGAVFAQRLGISAQFWSDLLRGRRRVPITFAQRLINVWPELEDAYIEDIRREIKGDRN